jgi:hypothetical protein
MGGSVAVAVDGWQLQWRGGISWDVNIDCLLTTISQSIVSNSILPLPHSIIYQNDRADPLFSTVPLPPNHCHSSQRCGSVLYPLLFFSPNFQKNLQHFSIDYNSANTATAALYHTQK